jgi:hypothetical protein
MSSSSRGEARDRHQILVKNECIGSQLLKTIMPAEAQALSASSPKPIGTFLGWAGPTKKTRRVSALTGEAESLGCALESAITKTDIWLPLMKTTSS